MTSLKAHQVRSCRPSAPAWTMRLSQMARRAGCVPSTCALPPGRPLRRLWIAEAQAFGVHSGTIDQSGELLEGLKWDMVRWRTVWLHPARHAGWP